MMSTPLRFMCIILSCLLTRMSVGATVVWTGLGDGVNWAQGSNWSSTPNTPGVGDDVVIGAGAPVVHVSGGSVRSLSLGRTIAIDGPLYLAGGLSMQNAVRIELRSLLVFDGGDQSISGPGTVAMASSGTIRLQRGCWLTIEQNTTMEGGIGGPTLYSDVLIECMDTGTDRTPRIINRGVLRAAVDGARIDVRVIGSPNAQGTFENTGLLAVHAGSSAFLDITLANTGSLTMGDASALVLARVPQTLGTLTRGSGTRLIYQSPRTNDGILTASAATGTITLTGVCTGLRLASTDGSGFELGLEAKITAVEAPTLDACTIDAPTTIRGPTKVRNGLAIAAGRTLAVAQTLEFLSGAQSLAGPGTIRFVGPNSVALTGCTLTLSADLTVDGASGTPDTLTNISFRSTSYQLPCRIINYGLIRADAGVNFLSFSGGGFYSAGASLVNAGRIEIAGGTRFFNDWGFTNSGIFVLGDGTIADFAGPDFQPGTITRGANTTLSVAALSASGVFILGPNIGSVRLTAGRYTGVTFQAAPGLHYEIDGTTFDACIIDAPATINNLTCQNGLTVGPRADITLSGNLNFIGGPAYQSLDGSGTITFTQGSIWLENTIDVTIEPGITLRALTPNSRLNFYRGPYAPPPNGSITNRGTIVLSGASSSVFSQNFGPGLINAGVISLQGGAGLTLLDTDLNNTGTITVETGGVIDVAGALTSLGTLTRATNTTFRLKSPMPAGSTFILTPTLAPLTLNNVSVQGVTFAATGASGLTINGGILNACVLNTPVTFTGSVTVMNGLVVNDTLTLDDNTWLIFSSSTQTLSGTGRVVIRSGASSTIGVFNTTLTIADGFPITLDQNDAKPGTLRLNIPTGTTFDNRGIIRVSGMGRQLILQSGSYTPSTLTNHGLIDIGPDATLTLWSALTLSNLGTITLGPRAQFLDQGDYTADLGDFRVDPTGGVTYNSPPTLPDGTEIVLPAAFGTVTFSQDTFTGRTFRAGAGTRLVLAECTLGACVFDLPVEITGNTSVTGDLSVASGMRLTLRNATLNFTGTRTLWGPGEMVVPSGSLALFRVASGPSLTLGPTLTLRTDDRPALPTTISVSLSTNSASPSTLVAKGAIRIDGPGGLLRLTGTRQRAAAGTPGARFDGMLDLRDGAHMSAVSYTTTTLGKLVPGGMLDLRVAGTLTLAPGVAITAGTGAAWTIEPAGRLDVHIKGLASDALAWPRLITAGDFTVGGAASVTFDAPFSPPSCAPGYRLVSVTNSGTVSGVFASMTTPPAPTGARSVLLISPAALDFVRSGLADMTDRAGTGIADGTLSPADLVQYFTQFFAGCPSQAIPCAVSDITDRAGTGPADGVLSTSDLVAFFSAFFAGCEN